tara:strand:+ start:754 stop:1380 length:627 start_codon:yes stop_codon:yes gene_type:complete
MWKNVKHHAQKKIRHHWYKFQNTIDPISLQIVRKRFVLIRNKSTMIYDANNLLQYITCSGDFRDPVSRTEFNDCELIRLSRIVGENPYLLVHNKENFKTKRLENIAIDIAHNGLCDVFESEIEESIENLRRFDNNDYYLEYLQFETYFTEVFVPNVIHSFTNLQVIDNTRCKNFLKLLNTRLSHHPFYNREILAQLFNIFRILKTYCP